MIESKMPNLVLAMWSGGTCACMKGVLLHDRVFGEMMLLSPGLMKSLLELDAFFVDAAPGDPLDPRA